MRKWVLVTAFLMSAFSGTSYAEEILTFAHSFPGDGNVFENRISVEALSKLPSWDADKELPPIDSSKALKIAREYLRNNKEEFINAVVSEIKIEQFVVPKYVKDKWYYVITFLKKTPESCSVPDATSVFIMMDGTVNEPVLARFDPQLNFK